MIKKCMEHSNLQKDDVDTVYMGQVLQAGTGQNPARQSAMKAGIDKSTSATTINQVCGSGLSAISLGFNSLKLKDTKIVIAGGQESMTNSPHYINFRKDKILSENKLKDSMIVDGLIDFYNQYHMGVTAENVAKKFSISRNDQDLFAYKSQIKTKEAINNGKFNDEIVSIKLKNGMTFNKDEHP